MPRAYISNDPFHDRKPESPGHAESAQLRRAAGDIASLDAKATPANADLLVIEDSAAGYLKKKVQVGALPGGAGGTPASTVEDETTWGVPPAVGTDTEYARQDHTHGTPTIPGIDALTDVDTTTDPPITDEVLKWNGSQWVPAAYGATFEFSITGFSDGISDTYQLIGAGTWQAIGAISFTATYANAPGGMTAWVAMSGSSVAWAGDLYLTPVTGPELNTEAVAYPSSATGTITFTLHQSADATTDTETVSFANTMRYGTNALSQGNQTEVSIEALIEVAGPDETRSQTVSNIATDAGKYLVFAWASRLSSVAQVQMSSGFGYVTASFAAAATTLAPDIQTTGLTTITNSAGFIEAFKAVTSRLTDLTNGTNDFQVLTSSTAQNYLYWGELAKASGYTETDVEGNYATQPGKVASNSMSSRSMIVNATAGEYTYIAYPARLGALTSIVIGGFESLGDFNVDNTALAVTNDAGYQENYRVYVSKNPGFTDPTTMTVTI